MKLIPPDGPSKLRQIKRDAELFIRDAQWWNTNRPDAAPMDCEDCRVIVALASKGLEAAERNDGDEYSRIATQIASVGEQCITSAIEDGSYKGGAWPCGCVRRDRDGNPTHLKINHPSRAACSTCGAQRPEVRQ